MLERYLSKQGLCVYGVVLALLVAYVLFGVMTESDIPAQVNQFQARAIFGGVYHRKLTFSVLVILALLVALPFGFLYDLLTRQGIFAKGK